MKTAGIATFLMMWGYLFFLIPNVSASDLPGEWDLLNPGAEVRYTIDRIWSNPEIWPAAYLLSKSGRVEYYDGTERITILTDSTYGLQDIWGADANAVFVVGNTILFWNGSTWQNMQDNSGIPLSGNCIWGRSAQDVYVGQGEKLLYWDGVTWSVMHTLADWNIRDIWGAGTEDLYLVGHENDIMHWDGISWTDIGQPQSYPNETVFSIGGTGTEDVYVFAYRATMYTPTYYISRFDGSQWTLVASLHQYCNDIQNNDTDVWFVGKEGMCYRSKNGSIEEMTTPTEQHIRGVAVGAGDEAYLVGDFNTFIKYDGTEFTMLNPYPCADLNCIWVYNHNRAYAAGELGTMLYWCGSSWTSIKSGTEKELHGIWGSSPGNVWAVGVDGIIVHWVGYASIIYTAVTDKTLHDIWGASSSDVFAVGNEGVIVHYNGTKWSPFSFGYSSDIYKIWGADSNDIFVGDENGDVFHWDGANWSVSLQGTGWGVRSLWGSSGIDVYAASNRLWHWDGSDWESVSNLGYSSTILQISGTAQNRVFVEAVWHDIHGIPTEQMYLFNGSEWQLLNRGAVYDVGAPTAIYASDYNMLFTVNTDGIIYRFREYPVTATIKLATSLAHPGDTFWVQAEFENCSHTDFSALPTFCVLEVLGAYYFWPDWTLYNPPEYPSINYETCDFPQGITTVTFLDAFVWPNTGSDSLTGMYFYSVILDEDLATSKSNLAVVAFGYGP